MTKTIRATFIKHAWLPLLVLPLGAQAQTLTLFEPTETSNAPQAQAAGPGTGIVSGGGGQPAFTLRSTSRIGDSYHVVLVGRDGAISQVAWQAGQSAAVPDHGGFAITQVSGRSVTLAQPEPCVSAPDKGVSCGVDNQALLALSTAAPAIAQSQQPAPKPNQQDPFAAAAAAAAQNGGPPPELGIRRQGGQAVVINPFTGEPETVEQLSPEQQAARADRQRQRADRLRAFQARRIEDADIPPGMQRVRTPFGDTLQPIQ
jgi:hypothetical protein